MCTGSTATSRSSAPSSRLIEMTPAAPPAIIPNDEVAWSIGISFDSSSPEATLSARVATQTTTTATAFDATSLSVDDWRYPPTVTPITAWERTVAGRGRSRRQRARSANARPAANPAKSGGVGTPTRSKAIASATTPAAIASQRSAVKRPRIAGSSVPAGHDRAERREIVHREPCAT